MIIFLAVVVGGIYGCNPTNVQFICSNSNIGGNYGSINIYYWFNIRIIYNVVGLRLPNKNSIIKPGSHCLKCNHKLAWWENIPVISYIFLKGRCKSCKEKISFMYPGMELLTALLFTISYKLFGFSYEFYISLVLASLVVLIFITDSKYMIILDEVLIAGGVLITVIEIIYQGIDKTLISLGYGLVIFILFMS